MYRSKNWTFMDQNKVNINKNTRKDHGQHLAILTTKAYSKAY